MTSHPHLAASRLQPLRASSLAAWPWLHHCFSTRAGGRTTVYGQPDDLNLGLTTIDDPDVVYENRRRLREATAPPGESWPIVTARQTHSATICSVSALIEPGEEADALLTATPSLFLGIFTADCVPILLADTRLRVVAAIHAGWRGTAARIAASTIQTMYDRFRCAPQDILAAIGPSIGPCCYHVGDEVRQAFPNDPDLFSDDSRLDLWRANRRQLLAAGIPAGGIQTLAQCTACARTHDGARRFFSHRAEAGRTGRMMSLIGIAPGSAPLIR